jgi:hypothetical protein
MESVTLPAWLFAILVALSLWALLQLALVPGVRWYLRRKVNRVILEINTRFNVELPQFKLTRRSGRSTRRASATWFSYRWASITTACSRTARCSRRSMRQRPAADSSTRRQERRDSSGTTCGWRRRGAGSGSGMHASISAGPFPCGSTLLSHAVDFRRLDEASRHREIGRVAGLVMERIARIIPVLPVSLLAAVSCAGTGKGCPSWN